jgi:hypothetical protein
VRHGDAFGEHHARRIHDQVFAHLKAAMRGPEVNWREVWQELMRPPYGR